MDLAPCPVFEQAAYLPRLPDISRVIPAASGAKLERNVACRRKPPVVGKVDQVALEDKIVQRAVAAVLNAIYEEDFLGFSYGFRPGRGQHDVKLPRFRGHFSI